MSKHTFPKILGTATLNEKGQVVIPAEARSEMGLTSGSKLVLVKNPEKQALIILKAEDIEAMLEDFSKALSD